MIESTGKIILLTVGRDMKTFYRVGGSFPQLNVTITEIILDKNYLIEKGVEKFRVYCKNSKNQERLFVTITDMPTQVQDDVNDELINNI